MSCSTCPACSTCHGGRCHSSRACRRACGRVCGREHESPSPCRCAPGECPPSPGLGSTGGSARRGSPPSQPRHLTRRPHQGSARTGTLRRVRGTHQWRRCTAFRTWGGTRHPLIFSATTSSSHPGAPLPADLNRAACRPRARIAPFFARSQACGAPSFERSHPPSAHSRVSLWRAREPMRARERAHATAQIFDPARACARAGERRDPGMLARGRRARALLSIFLQARARRALSAGGLGRLLAAASRMCLRARAHAPDKFVSACALATRHGAIDSARAIARAHFPSIPPAPP